MNRTDIQIKVDNLENLIWSMNLRLKHLFHNNELTLLSKNVAYENVFKEKTCFIIGNGPSLKYETRLSELKKYPTFTVNQFYRSELFEKVSPTFHVMVDPQFFSLRENIPFENDTLKRIKKISRDSKVKMIFPIEYHDYIVQHIGNAENHLYIKGRYKMGECYKMGFDMSGYIPAANNVVLTAIYCAIYMGFKKIVLLGSDMTGLLDSYVRRSPKLDEKFSHIYEYTDEEKERMRKVHLTHNNETMLQGFATMFKDYRCIYEYCKINDIDLSNASKETALDNLPFSNLDEILDVLEKENEKKG